MTELSEYVTAAMIAKETGIGYHTILARIHRKKVPITLLGKIVTIKREDASRISYPLYRGQGK